MNERTNSVIYYRLLVIASLSIGIILNLYNTNDVTIILSYYTSQINIMCLINFIVVEVAEIRNKDYRSSEIYYFIKGQLVMAVLMMIIIFNLSLLPRFDMIPNTFERRTVYKTISNVLLHEVSPILVILDYILFDNKGNFKKYYPIAWFFIPLNYLIYVYIYSLNGGYFYNTGGSNKFAYFFLDYRKVGYEGVINWLIVIIITILILGYIIVIIDNLLAKLRKKKIYKN